MFKVTLRTGIAAFHDEYNPEIDRYVTATEIIRILEDRVIPVLRNGGTECKLFDINGVSVGVMELK